MKCVYTALALCITLGACAAANTNTRDLIFQQESYKFTAFQNQDGGFRNHLYTARNHPERSLILTGEALPPYVTAQEYVNQRMQLEQRHRKNDCTVTKKSLRQTVYYVCQVRHEPTTLVYLPGAVKGYGFVKIYGNKKGLSSAGQQKAAEDLIRLELPFPTE
ncbi:hypothetical protein [Neisseria iguanae]|uniref:Uncharacterized protein n=1 Tax=Neisseria iguanae TaxID=90242 RepID=A0A2P7U2Y2_9NEIS|nr:hypothetical protein [Neisseria iguanae]PSJ81273.1 hypothetical protein C7N83_01655 [Neisseria iguanae]